jgi:hypothetical protein
MGKVTPAGPLHEISSTPLNGFDPTHDCAIAVALRFVRRLHVRRAVDNRQFYRNHEGSDYCLVDYARVESLRHSFLGLLWPNSYRSPAAFSMISDLSGALFSAQLDEVTRVGVIHG